ncbi:MAG: hypothetical protein ABF449_02235 [Ethanoligenens sp.]
MYASFWNQFYQMSHYLVSFCILFVLFPLAAFLRPKGDRFELLARNYLKMVFFVIAVGYLLVITQLFEVIGILLAMFCLCLALLLIHRSLPRINRKLIRLVAYVFDVADENRSSRQDICGHFRALQNGVKRRLARLRAHPSALLTVVLFLAVLFFSCGLRFYDAFIYPQPNMSDGSVTLSWIKQIDLRELFVNGIYPQGFSIYMASLQKFAFIDALYILKYTGPFNELLILLGIYFVVSRFTGRKLPGILAMGIYGLCFRYLPSEYTRQAATNSQEFGLVFLLPTLYFYKKYLDEGNRTNLLAAFCGLAVTGLVHTVAFAFTGVGVVLLTVLYLAAHFRITLRRGKWVVLSAVVSIILAVSPAVIGHYILGIAYYASSQDYAQSFAHYAIRALTGREFLMAGMLVILLAGAVVLCIRRLDAKMGVLFCTVFAAVSMAVYLAGGHFTGIGVLEDRSGELYALLIAVTGGMTLYVLFGPLRTLWARHVLELGACIGLAGVTIVYIRPQPIIPYKMMNPYAVDEYLYISTHYTPTDWLIVSYDETYDLALCSGFHLLTDDFLKRFSPDSEYLYDRTTKKSYVQPYVFLYYEKNLYYDGVESTTYTLAKRREHNAALKTWANEHMAKYSNLTVFYENSDFMVYKLDQSKATTKNIIK